MRINFRELKTTIFRENKLSRILENKYFAASNFREFASYLIGEKFVGVMFRRLKYFVG